MNLKELIKEVEGIKCRVYGEDDFEIAFEENNKLLGIKQTVETVNNDFYGLIPGNRFRKDWQKLKKLVGVK